MTTAVIELLHHAAAIAPLGVHLDATNSVFTAGTWKEAYYYWDCDDPDGIHSKVQGHYPCFYHAFEKPGTYVIKLSIIDKGGNTATSFVTLVVNAFDGATRYVDSISGADSNDGMTEQSAWRTLKRAAAGCDALFTLQPPIRPRVGRVRLLFNRGGVYATSETTNMIGIRGDPYIWDAYGTGPEPIIEDLRIGASGSTTIYNGYSCENITFANLEFRGQQDPRSLNSVAPAGIVCVPDTDINWQNLNYHRLWLRCRFTKLHLGVAITTNVKQPNVRNVGYVGCTFDLNNDIHIFTSALYSGVIGCRVTNTLNSHLSRFWSCDKTVIAKNYFLEPSILPGSLTRLAAKIHADDGGTTVFGVSEKIIICENVFQGSLGNIALAPQNSGLANLGHLKDAIIARNAFLPSALPTQVPLAININLSAAGCLIINNVFVGPINGSNWEAIEINGYAGGQTLDANIIANNVFAHLSSKRADLVAAVGLHGAAGIITNLKLYNNILYTRDTASHSCFFVKLDGGITRAAIVADEKNVFFQKLPTGTKYWAYENGTSHTLTAWQAFAPLGLNCSEADPVFADPDARDFRLLPASPFDADGKILDFMFEDFLGELRTR